VRLLLDVYGDRQLDRELLLVGHRATNMRPAFARVGEHLRQAEQQLFRTSGASSGNPWPPLQPSTVASKARSKNPTVRANAQKVLIATGDLRTSLTRSHGKGHVERATDDGLVFGSRVSYGRFHQHGTKNMRQRRVVDLSERDKRDAMRILQHFWRTGELV
jgi:phage gpG-like protein